VIALRADAKAPAEANLTLAAAGTVGGQAYNHPPLTVALLVAKK
jgi:hypothetical protein